MLSCRGISCVGEVREVFAGGRARVEGGYKASDGCLMDLEANTQMTDLASGPESSPTWQPSACYQRKTVSMCQQDIDTGVAHYLGFCSGSNLVLCCVVDHM